jgi:hypothetical protein
MSQYPEKVLAQYSTLKGRDKEYARSVIHQMLSLTDKLGEINDVEPLFPADSPMRSVK